MCDAPCTPVLVLQHSWIFTNLSTATPPYNLLLPLLLLAAWIQPRPGETRTGLASLFEGASSTRLLSARGKHCHDVLELLRHNCFAHVQGAATLNNITQILCWHRLHQHIAKHLTQAQYSSLTEFFLGGKKKKKAAFYEMSSILFIVAGNKD